MKRIYYLLVVSLLCSLTASAYEFESGGILYYWIKNQEVIVYRVSQQYSGDMVIPSSVERNGYDYTVTGIGYEAFYCCKGMSSVTIPNSVTSIEDDAFRGCSSLTSIVIPNSVTSIGGGAFSGCSGLTNIKVEEGNPVYDSRNDCNAIIVTASNELLQGCANTIIPNTVTSIAFGAFEGNKGLTDLIIPNSVTTIGNQACYGCTGLTNLIIPKSVSSIGNYAFNDCIGLTSIKVEEGNPVYDSRNDCNAIIETSSNILLKGSSNTTIPNSVTGIDFSAFEGNKGLTNLIIPNSVTFIGGAAFRNCSSLSELTIPKSVTFIGNFAFNGCSALSSIKVEEGNPKYDSRNDCNAIIETSLNELIQGCSNSIIPNSVTSIGSGAFSGCSGLTSIICDAITPPVCVAAFVGVPVSEVTLYVPDASVEAYKEANVWKDFNVVPRSTAVGGVQEGKFLTGTLYVYDTTGKLLKTVEGASNANGAVAGLKAGTYIIKGNGESIKVVKE